MAAGPAGRRKSVDLSPLSRRERHHRRRQSSWRGNGAFYFGRATLI
jgi:hypothetical protein